MTVNRKAGSVTVTLPKAWWNRQHGCLAHRQNVYVPSRKSCASRLSSSVPPTATATCRNGNPCVPAWTIMLAPKPHATIAAD